MNFIIVSNITETDARNSKIRITKEFKFLFPSEKLGRPETYPISVKFNGTVYAASYSIGSKDGKSRSGLFNLGSSLYKDIIGIKSGTKLKITKNDHLKYIVERV